MINLMILYQKIGSKLYLEKMIHLKRQIDFGSALVGYIYTQVGILDKSTDWSVMRPSDFSVEKENLNYTGRFLLDNNEITLF